MEYKTHATCSRVDSGWPSKSRIRFLALSSLSSSRNAKYLSSLPPACRKIFMERIVSRDFVGKYLKISHGIMNDGTINRQTLLPIILLFVYFDEHEINSSLWWDAFNSE